MFSFGGFPIPDISRLSLQARLAIALWLFARYCEKPGLEHPEITAFSDYLWEFLALPSSAEALNDWASRCPPLVGNGLGEQLPSGFEAFVTGQGVSISKFQQAVTCTTEILYGSMYAAANDWESRRYFDSLAEMAVASGVPFPDMQPFSGSLWSEGHGWGARLSPEELAAWRVA